MSFSKEKLWRAAEHRMKRTEAYQEQRGFGQQEPYEVVYILAKGNRQNPEQVIAYVSDREGFVMSFHPLKQDAVTHNRDFNFDGDLFEYLEDGYELVGMTMDTHYNAWCCIEQWHGGDIDHMKGMQKYLGYCKRNGITAEKLKTELGYSSMDVLTLYDPKMDRTKPRKDLER